MNEDVQKNKGMAVLAYLSWLLLVPLFCAKESKFARFHVNQGITLAIFGTIWWLIEIIISACTAWIPIVGSIVGALLAIPNLFFLVFVIIGIINAVNGEEKPLPLFGKIHFFTV